MRTAMRPRYYCDHCNKGNGSPSAMKRHERGCTLNPARVCGMCAALVDEGGEAAAPPDELKRVLEAEGFQAMCEAANGCPACILTVLRPINWHDEETGRSGVAGPQDGRESWQYSKAKADWWAEFNSVDCRSYPV